MSSAELRAFASRVRKDLHVTSTMLAQVETRIALAECGRVSGRAGGLQQKLHPTDMRSPASGAAIGSDLQIFHDAGDCSLTVHQRAGASGSDLAPFPLEIGIFQFDGGFLSVVYNVADDLVRGTGEQDVFELSFVVDAETACELSLRINIRHGPNETQMIRSSRSSPRRQTQSFDLAEAGLSHRPVERIWIDVIVSDPAMNRISISDLIARRRARAQV